MAKKIERNITWEDKVISYINNKLASNIGASKVDVLETKIVSSKFKVGLGVKIQVDGDKKYFAVGDSIDELIQHIKNCINNNRTV